MSRYPLTGLAQAFGRAIAEGEALCADLVAGAVDRGREGPIRRFLAYVTPLLP